VAVQRLEIEFGAPVDPSEFRALPGVREAHAEGSTVTVGIEGSADAVVKAAARHEVLAIRPHEDDLEDIFLRYYQERPVKESPVKESPVKQSPVKRSST
jgi:ABC-2 type transport system ATP-binding protein